MSQEKTDGFNKIQKIMELKKPFFIGRLSGNEAAITGQCLVGNLKQYTIMHTTNGAGLFFKDSNSIKEFARLYLFSIKNCNLLGIWDGGMRSQAIELYNLLDKFKKPEDCVPAQCVEPYYFLRPTHYNVGVDYKFNQLIKGKRILILSSHVKTIQQQLEKVNDIFPGHKIFEDNEFVILQPPVTNAGNHNNIDWREYFKAFKEKIYERRNDFDIVFGSCGGYGMIICDYIYKELGKSCIYMGGGLQILFGIMGERWKNNQALIDYGYKNNPNWCTPLPDDIPKNYKFVEGGCYW